MPPIEDIEDGTNTARQRRERSMPSINEEGEIGNPALLFNCMKERITFYADFKQIDIVGNQIKSKK